MKLYSKFGDDGETELCDGTRVWKDDPRVAAYGGVDELNAVLGWCRLVAGASDVVAAVARVQQDLFVLGAQLATTAGGNAAGTNVALGPGDIRRLEQWIEQATARVEPLSNFVLPGGCELAARLHVARTVCRRAERVVISLHRIQPTADEVIVYLNRLGDLLFAWARLANRQANCSDDPWRPGQT